MSRLELAGFLQDLIPQDTAHGTGRKIVFRNNEQMSHKCTQIAYGVFEVGEVCETHIHPTMYEYFFFIKGRGTYKVGEQIINLIPQTFLEIPAGVEHSLHADKAEKLEFVYWGIATD